MEIWGKRISGRRKSLCKDPEVKVCLVCFRNDLEAGADGCQIEPIHMQDSKAIFISDKQ